MHTDFNDTIIIIITSIEGGEGATRFSKIIKWRGRGEGGGEYFL